MGDPPPTDPIAARYEEILREICAFVQEGRPPWWNRSARLGLPILGRSGQILRGLPAVIAWHLGDLSEGYPLAWRLRPTEGADLARSAVFRLAANGGDALYVATPDERPQQALDSPTSDLVSQWSLGKLDKHLDNALGALRYAIPQLELDRYAILSLAQAFIRPLGDSREPTSIFFDGRWTPKRMARVAAWARLVADEVRLAENSRTVDLRDWPLARSWSDVDFYGMPAPPHGVSPTLANLCRAGWLQQCLPAELREPPASQQLPQRHRSSKHLVPEQPLRPGLFYGKALVRSPALAGAARFLRTLPKDGPEIDPRMELIRQMRWHEHAGLGLALAQKLEVDILPSEPGQAWRAVGRRFCSALKEKKNSNLARQTNETLLLFKLNTELKIWQSLRKHHSLRNWFHPDISISLTQLINTGRWEHSDLENYLQSFGNGDWHIGPAKWLLSKLPIVHIASLRTHKKKSSTDEEKIKEQIASSMQCEPQWSAITDAAENAKWRCRKMLKSDGGTRWLDIPSDELRNAQRVVSRLLFSRFPPQGSATAFHPGASPALHARAHVGAAAALKMDIRNFFGSVRPSHLRPWFGLDARGTDNILPDWSHEGRLSLMTLIFRTKESTAFLPQGGPSSPVAANLAALRLDRAVVKLAKEAFGPVPFTYTRYADDLVISTRETSMGLEFVERAKPVLERAIIDQKWRPHPSKTRSWTLLDGEPLRLCGIRVPSSPAGKLRLDRELERRARAALHQLRHRADFDRGAEGSPNRAHGLLAYCYAATADPRWLAYTSRRLRSLALALAGPLFSESFLAGWSDG